MKKIFLFVFFSFLLLNHAAMAQVSFSSTNNGPTMVAADINGNSLMNDKYEPDIEGSPFLIKDWSIATLLTRKGLQVNNVLVKLNIESNELYYLDSAGKTWIAVPGNVVKITFANLDAKLMGSNIFKSGYPAIGKQTSNYYYQVLADGNITLLRKIYKTISTLKNELSGEKSRSFEEGSWLYIFAAGQIRELKNDKEAILELMKDKQAAIEKYMDANKVNFKKAADLEKLIGYYNHLN